MGFPFASFGAFARISSICRISSSLFFISCARNVVYAVSHSIFLSSSSGNSLPSASSSAFICSSMMRSRVLNVSGRSARTPHDARSRLREVPPARWSGAAMLFCSCSAHPFRHGKEGLSRKVSNIGR